MLQSKPMRYAEVIFQQKTGLDKDTLTYSLPESEDFKIGQSVLVPLRRQKKNGVIWKIHSEKPSFPTQKVIKINNPHPLLTDLQIKLVEWISSYYFPPVYRTLKLFIPKRVFDQKPIKERKKKTIEQITRSKTLNHTEDQKAAIERILTSKENTFLIHGVTGSGKTEVYTQLANNYLAQSKQVLILVPEISLTPQIIDYFERSLGHEATVIHSKKSEGERYGAWERIWKGEAKLIIGSRSSLFSPFQNLGLIIMDEEHENSYKQESTPRYSAHQVIEKIQEENPEVKWVLGSATPSIETAEKLKDRTIELAERVGAGSLPEVSIVDLREEFKKGNYSIFSEELAKELKDTLANQAQAILFINRRGSASSVVCRDCGFRVDCENCELPMTYHEKTLNKGSLICHHCGEISKPPTTCPTCNGINIRYLGIGTQRIEAEIKKLLPTARIVRADKDTTSEKEGFKKIYQTLKNHEADILIGTQMIAKGLHLPKVQLVGVVLADIGLNIPNFKSAERNFQLMTQVAGRAGRTNDKGKVVIQTYNPENISLICAKTHDYKAFFTYERNQRKLLHNPPFGTLATITFSDPSLKMCKEQTEALEGQLWKIARKSNLTEHLEINSYPSYLMRIKNNYRYTILIKSRDTAVENKHIHKILEKLPKAYIMSPNIKIDIDPISF